MIYQLHWLLPSVVLSMAAKGAFAAQEARLCDSSPYDIRSISSIYSSSGSSNAFYMLDSSSDERNKSAVIKNEFPEAHGHERGEAAECLTPPSSPVRRSMRSAMPEGRFYLGVSCVCPQERLTIMPPRKSFRHAGVGVRLRPVVTIMRQEDIGCQADKAEQSFNCSAVCGGTDSPEGGISPISSSWWGVELRERKTSDASTQADDATELRDAGVQTMDTEVTAANCDISSMPKYGLTLKQRPSLKPWQVMVIELMRP